MFERFTTEARGIVVDAQEQARRLGDGSVGCEHLLLAVASSAGETGLMLRGAGVTPTAVESAARRLRAAPDRDASGRDASDRDVSDRDALATIGIDLDLVRRRVEEVFGPGALRRPPERRGRWRRPRWRRRRRDWDRLGRGRGRRPHGRGDRRPSPGGAPGCDRGSGVVGEHVPFTGAAKKALELSVREALALRHRHIGSEHLALALTRMTDGPAPRILADLGVSRARLHADLRDRHRHAG